MNRIDRLFGILLLLQSRKYTTAEALAEKFGISVRTVYRDIKALAEQGVPLCFEPHKGYCLVQGYFLPPVSFTSEEANALLLMERMVPGFADRSITTHYTSALNKVKGVLRGAQKEKLEQLNQTLYLQLPACMDNNYEHLATLQNAISAKNILRLLYTNQKEENSQRLVEPIGLIFYAFNWHLIAWCHLRAEYRDFRVSRIVEIQHTGRPFEKEDHLPLSDYLKQLPVAY